MPSPVVLSTVPAEAFLAVLEFLYTNSVKLHRHSVSPLGRGLGGRGREWAEGRGNSLLLQPPTLQVLEVLTAAVEYGLEELREVCLCGRPLSCFPCLYVLSSYPASHTLSWRGKCTNISLCNRHLCVLVCKRIPLCPVFAVEAYHRVLMADAIDTKINQT